MAAEDRKLGVVRARVTEHDLTIALEDRRVVRFDAEGRWCTFRREEEFFRRVLDGQVVVRWGARAVPVSEERVRWVHAEAARWAGELIGLVEREDSPPQVIGDADRIVPWLRAATRWTAERFEGLRARFAQAYPEPVPILPPDRYGDLVVLPAMGCPYGRCSFCHFYRDPDFRVLSPAEFEAHLEALGSFFGRALRGRDGVFLGSASAVSLGQRVLLRTLERVRDVLGSPRRGVAAFHDPDHAPERTLSQYRELVDAGLGDVLIGLETGLGRLREALGKRGELDRVQAAVGALKEAGMQVALSILIGAGGLEAADAHRAETGAFISRLPLEERDLVYLSPLEGALPSAALAAQQRRFREDLVARTPARVVPYYVSLYRYYA